MANPADAAKDRAGLTLRGARGIFIYQRGAP